jgi:zinc protease
VRSIRPRAAAQRLPAVRLTRVLRWATLLAALLGAPVLAAQSSTDSAQVVRRDTLPNGLTIIVVENHAVPLATLHIVFRGGAATQTTELQGVPHLFEHMLFKSYKSSDNSSFGANAALSKSSYNGGTGDEEVSYTLWLPSDKLGENVQLLADLVREPYFEDDKLQTERFVVRNEMQRAQSQPSYLLADAASRALWGNWYERKNTIGTDIALFTANAHKLKELYDIWYVPNNAALVVTGDVQAAKVFSEVRKHFGRWRRAADPFAKYPVPAPPPFDSTFAFVYTHEVQTVTVHLSWRGPTLAANAADAADGRAFSNLLSAEDSPFQRDLVDAGHFSDADFSVDLNRFGSEIRFTGTTTQVQLTNALGALGTIIGQLGNDGYYDANALLAEAKRRRVARAIGAEESSGLASALGSAWAAGRMAEYGSAPATRRESTPESIAAFAGKWLINKPYVIGVLTPVGTEQAASTTLGQYIAFMKQ